MPNGLQVALYLFGAWSWGRGSTRFRVVWFGGLKVRKARVMLLMFMTLVMSSCIVCPFAGPQAQAQGRHGCMDSMIRSGVSFARSIELTVERDCIPKTGPVYPVTLDDLQSGRDGGIGEFRRVVGDLQCRLTDFVHRVVVHRWDESREDLESAYTSGCGLTWCLLPLFFRVSLILLLVVLEFWPIPPGLMRNSERLGFPTFVALGKGRPALTN